MLVAGLGSTLFQLEAKASHVFQRQTCLGVHVNSTNTLYYTRKYHCNSSIDSQLWYWTEDFLVHFATGLPDILFTSN